MSEVKLPDCKGLRIDVFGFCADGVQVFSVQTQIVFAQLKFHGLLATYVHLQSLRKHTVAVQQGPATEAMVKCLCETGARGEEVPGLCCEEINSRGIRWG